jgi:hypothetical protein
MVNQLLIKFAMLVGPSCGIDGWKGRGLVGGGAGIGLGMGPGLLVSSCAQAVPSLEVNSVVNVSSNWGLQ